MAGDIVTAADGGTITIFSGAVPANCAAADPSGTLATATLPGQRGSFGGHYYCKAEQWSLAPAAPAQARRHPFWLYTSGAVLLCAERVTASGGGGVMEIDNAISRFRRPAPFHP